MTLTSALGSSLVNMLYVLDEPSVGLHPRDVDRLIDAVGSLRERSNTVVVVEHEEAMLRALEQRRGYAEVRRMYHVPSNSF